jgi:peptide/nickel transport system substrate-binding protein
MKVTRFTRTAVALTAVVGLGAMGVMAPATAATRSTVVIVSSNALTSLNPLMNDTNLTLNVDVAYLTGSGFNYFNNKLSLVKNNVLGSYKIIKNTAKDFRVQYTVNKGRFWSDGTPIDGVDLLLSHILTSSAYSKKAGLGDPKDTKNPPAFNSINYGGVYDSHVVGLPLLSKDHMSVIIRWDSFQPDWEISGPAPSAVHTLVLLSAGKKKLGTAAENAAAKAKFLKLFTTYNKAGLTKIGKVWTNAYNIKAVSSKTNPLLLVNNGGYLVKSAVADQSVTMTPNPKYNSGPKTSGIKTIIFKFISDGTAAAQALANKEIDIYQGQPTADSVAQLKALHGVNVIGGSAALYEHVDLRVGAGPGTTDTYTGPFAASTDAAANAKAKDLRTAFLLAYPRQQIVDTLVKPINPTAVVDNSLFTLPGAPGYSEIVKASSVSKFTAGTQAERTAAALKLVQKYYPTAGASAPVKVNLLWGQPSNARRASEAELVKAEEAKAGFDVASAGTTGWSGHLTENKYDAQFFAWQQTSTSQTQTNATFQSDGGNMNTGYKNAALDAILHSLEAKLSPAQITAKYLAAEKILMQDAISLAIFQHPAVTAVNSALKNVKPSALSPTLVWNYWEWKY